MPLLNPLRGARPRSQSSRGHHGRAFERAGDHFCCAGIQLCSVPAPHDVGGLVITDSRMSAGREALLEDTSAVLVTVRGGPYGAGTPRQGLDHATGWYRRILADVWHLDLEVVEGELTNFGVNLALDQFEVLALTNRREAEEQAKRLGSELGVSTQPASLGLVGLATATRNSRNCSESSS